MREMTSRERFMAALKGERVDRLPVVSICQHATYEQMEQLQCFWPEGLSDPKIMAKMASGAYSILGFDAIRVPFCQTTEAEAFGAVLKDGGREAMPSVLTHPYHVGDAIEFPEDFLSRGRIPALLEAIRILKRNFGDKAVIIGGIIGPFSIASLFFDVKEFLLSTFKKPEVLLPAIEVGEKAGTVLAQAMIEAGADAIAVEDMMASMDMISPKIYRDLAWAAEKRQVAALSVPTIIHICGKLDSVLVDVARTGCAALSVEHMVNVPAALEKFAAEGITTPLIGAIDPVGTLFSGDAEKVKQDTRAAIAKGFAMISPGCAVPPATTTANLTAMVDTVKEVCATTAAEAVERRR
ncbi:MAG: MtaA/CmuA family methyltransferase [Thermodesulfovibrionales bacterium]